MKRRMVAGATVACAMTAAVPAVARAQDAAVLTGRVVSDRSGEGVAGATVAIPELNIGTLTNASGNFTLSVPAARVRGQSVGLAVRFIGFRPQRRTLTLTTGRQTLAFTLVTDASRLSEVVVTGVSVATERVKVPFAVTKIDSTQSPVTNINPLAQLQGKVPGANIVAASGRPGSPPSVLLRGPKSLNASGRSQEPLYIVDGVILNNGATFNGLGGSIGDINPQDIASVEVVKGAAAASLYGSQAANGVIQITTKRGSGAGGVHFGARSEYGKSDIENEIGIAQRQALLMNETQDRFCITNGLTAAVGVGCYRTVDYLSENVRINQNALDYATGTVSFPIDPGSGLQGRDARRMFQTNPWPGNNYDAVAEFARPQPLTINQLDMTGKFGGTDLFAAANYTDQGGGIKYLNGYQRGSFRLNAGQQVGSNVQIGGNTYFSRSAVDGFNQEAGGAAFFRLTRTPPIVDLGRTDSAGRLLIRPNIQGGGAQNENALYSLQNVSRIDYRDRFIGALSGRYTPSRYLNADASFGYDNEAQSGRQFSNRGYRTTGPAASPSTNNGAINTYNQNNRSMNGRVSAVAPNISPFQSLVLSPSISALYLQQDIEYRGQSGSQLSVSNVTDLQNATQTTLFAQATRQSVRQLTYSGGLRAEFRDRYIIDGAMRRDGNSTFGIENRWKNYGRIAGSWIVSSEPFFKNVSAIDLLKFSANYGTSGLQPAFSSQYETYTIGAGGTLTPATLGNSHLKPQVDKGSELIAEIGAFHNFNFTGTYALSHTFNQILLVTLPAAQRFQYQWQNAGTLQNKTVELALAFPVLKAKGLDWTGRATFERTITKITQLDIPAYVTGGTLQATDQLFRIAKGERVGTFYGRAFATSCSDLPANAAAVCGGPGSQYQKNSDGFIVWTGGYGLNEGYSGNHWNTTLAGNSAVAPYPLANINLAWGHPITRRDPTTGAALQVPLGQSLPKFRWSVNNSVSYKKFTLYGLVDAAVGQSVYNQGRGWSYLDFLSKDQDQSGKAVGDVKPISYYYRTQVENTSGLGGLYDILGPNNYFVEHASYAKLRETTVQYHVGRLGFARGDWTVGVTGRNLHTWTNYSGFDPEVGLTANNGAGSLGSGAISGVDAFTFPNLRTFSFNISTRF